MEDKNKLLETFQKLRDALFARDTEALKDLIHEDYIGYSPRGEAQDRALTLEAYGPDGTSLEVYDTEEIDTRIIGDAGIITGKGYIRGTWGGRTWEHNLRFLDLYIRDGDRWRFYMSQTTELETG